MAYSLDIITLGITSEGRVHRCSHSRDFALAHKHYCWLQIVVGSKFSWL